MACSYMSPDDTKSFMTDLNDLMESEKFLNNPTLEHHKSSFGKDDSVILLPRGGCVIKTKIGPI